MYWHVCVSVCECFTCISIRECICNVYVFRSLFDSVEDNCIFMTNGHALTGCLSIYVKDKLLGSQKVFCT